MASMCSRVTHILAINDLLTRFFQAFDDKNWPMMRDCLCDEVVTDYASFRGVPPSTISRNAYVEHRRTALESLDMQHNFFNLRVEMGTKEESAAARCNYLIHRYQSSPDAIVDDYFHSSGHYVFGCVRLDGAWKISR